MKAFQINASAAESVWHQALPFVERALVHDNGRMSADDLLAKIKDRDMQLWFGTRDGVLDMVAITEIRVWPQMKVARFVLLGGNDFDGWWAFAKPMFRAWAESKGCEQFEVGGRMAWLRKLKGWTLDAIVMRAEVSHA
jgi:hypothetical protein